jgi:hypothetical protein
MSIATVECDCEKNPASSAIGLSLGDYWQNLVSWMKSSPKTIAGAALSGFLLYKYITRVNFPF